MCQVPWVVKPVARRSSPANVPACCIEADCYRLRLQAPEGLPHPSHSGVFARVFARSASFLPGELQARSGALRIAQKDIRIGLSSIERDRRGLSKPANTLGVRHATRSRPCKSQSESGRVARAGKPAARLETQAVAIRRDASCGTDRRRRPASGRLSRPSHLAHQSTPNVRGLREA